MFSLLFFILPACLAYNHEYKAFNDCGFGGWHCYTVGDSEVVTYRCNQYDRYARIWIWTARIPSTTSILTVENCAYVEIHPDCTTGYRSYTLKEFKATNITTLEILKPLKPYVFLHDNDQYAHMPPTLVLENIGNVIANAGVFDKANGRCRVKSQQFEEFIARNVTFQDLFSHEFQDQVLKTFSLDRVTVGAVTRTRFSISANVTVANSTFRLLLPNMQITGRKVSFVGNDIRSIPAMTIKATCNDFLFTNNTVKDIGENGLAVTAQRVSITSNSFSNVHQDAFISITPGYGVITDLIVAQKFSYVFVGNDILWMASHALHPNYTFYAAVCSNLITTNNKLPCVCPNSPWSPTLAEKDLQPFYEKFIAKDNNNTCRENGLCNLAEVEILETQHGVCNGTKTISCDNTTLNLLTTPSTTTELPTTTTSTTTKRPTTTLWTTVISKSIEPVKSVERTSTKPVAASRNTSFVMLIITVILGLGGTVGGVIYYWIHKKGKVSITTATIYQNQCRSECDVQTLINER